MARVSIGLPVYNGENFVRPAITSVLAQSYRNWELIISDNGSDDSTQSICEKLASQDSRIRYVREPQNRGAAWNFNRVFELASGEYFRWLSHDDGLAPDSIQGCVDHLDKHDDVLCATRTQIIDSKGHQLLDADLNSDLGFQGLTEEGESLRRKLTSSSTPADRFKGILLHSIRCHEVYGLVRRETMQRTQLHPSYCGGEKVFLAELALLGTFAEIDTTESYSRWHDDRFSSNNSAIEQAEHMSPGAWASFALPHQYRATIGYLQLITTKGLPLTERLKCLLVWCRFVCQYKKWWAILANTLTGKATVATAVSPTAQGPLVLADGASRLPGEDEESPNGSTAQSDASGGDCPLNGDES